MLIKLFGENYRCLREPFELSLVAADLPSEGHRGMVEIPISGSATPLRLLRCAAIYGANASGKSSVLGAASALRFLIHESSRFVTPSESIPYYSPFLLSTESRHAPVKLGCTFVVDSVIHEYHIAFTASAVTSESLRRYTSDADEVLLRRDGADTGGLFLKDKTVDLLARNAAPNVPLLSRLAHVGPPSGPASVTRIVAVLASRLIFQDYSTYTSIGSWSVQRSFESVARLAHDNAEFREWLRDSFLGLADIGIVNITPKKEDIPAGNRAATPADDDTAISRRKEERFELLFTHAGTDAVEFPLASESAGTRKLLRMSPHWWRLARDNVTVIADELTAGLHPLMSDSLVRSVNELGSMNHSQVICATHDVELLESRHGEPSALRRDQVYFCQKGRDGASRLYGLAEFKDDARPVHNIRKRYLDDRYGAVPLIDLFPL